MWVNVCLQNIYRLTYKSASRPIGLDGSVGHFDGYDASEWLRYGNTVKFIWSGNIKLMKARLVWNYMCYYMSTEHIHSDE